MAYINKVMLLGNLTKDPELKYIPSGKAVCELRLAVSRPTGKAGGDKKEDVLFIDVTVWERTAELAAQYLKKGRPVYVEGRLQMDEWTDKDNQKRSKIRVTANDIQFLDSRPSETRAEGGAPESGGGYQRGGSSRPARQPAPEPASHDEFPPSEEPPMGEDQPF